MPYSILAPHYDHIGLSAYSEAITPKLLLQVQATFDWMGRKVIDLGCGTGASTRFLAMRGLNVTAIDQSPEMVAAARDQTNSEKIGLRWQVGDARTFSAAYTPNDRVDLVVALGLVNELGGLRDVEALFHAAARALEPGRMFVFDLETIEGLAGQVGVRVAFEDEHLLVLAQRSYDYERSIGTAHLTLFQAHEPAPGGERAWLRADAEVTRRGYPVQAIAALVGRCGFDVLGLMNAEAADLRPYDASAPHSARVMFFCRTGGGAS